MPRVCYYKPNRTRVRHFSEKDVRRIAKYAIQDGADPIKILAGVAVAAGLGYAFCIMVRAIDNTLNLGRGLAKIGGVLALGKLIDFLLTVVTNGAFKRLGQVNRVAAIIILAIGLLEGLLRAAKSILEDASTIDMASEMAHKLCDAAKEFAGEAKEAIDDKWTDIADYIDDTI